MFDWLWDNRQWVFSGIGVPVVVAIVAFISGRRTATMGGPTAPSADQKLFESFLALLPSSSAAIEFLQTNNMAGFSFDPERLNDLETFLRTWDDAEHEFRDPLLDEKRRELLDVANRYLHLIAIETFPTRNGRQTVPQEWEYEQPERFTAVVEDFHNTAHLFCTLHQEFIRLGRKQLTP